MIFIVIVTVIISFELLYIVTKCQIICMAAKEIP